MKSIVKRSAEAQAISILREHILHGTVAPGARLTEMELAGDLKVARATVRTALHHLAQEGIVVQTPYTGWAVADLSSVDAWELCTLRAALESLAARLAAQTSTELGQRRLATAMANLERASGTGALAAMAEADFALHQTIVAASGHRRLAEQYRIVEQQVRLYIASSDALVPSGEELVEQHRPLVAAILAGDADGAAELAETHNLSEGEKLVAHLRRREAARRA